MPKGPSPWRCPRCGRSFAYPNQWHSCGKFSVEDHLAHTNARVVELYRRFEAMVRACGPVHISAAKTLISFRSRSVFAAVRLGKDGLRGDFMLARPVENPRISKMISLSPRRHAHAFSVKRVEDLDRELQTWLCEAYQIGQGGRASRSMKPPSKGRQAGTKVPAKSPTQDDGNC